jgi:hypothetical protein
MDTAVALVKSYLELCGYFVLAELPVRAADDYGYHDVTDLDVIAVRFPHPPRAASRVNAPLDLFLGLDPRLDTFEDGVDVVIGEVKVGHARLNPSLRRAGTVAFALRRVGCCPESEVESEASRIVNTGGADMTMAGGLPCRVRLVAFAGSGMADERGVLTVPLRHCAAFIARRLSETSVAPGAQFKDPVLGLFALQAKLGAPWALHGQAV